jgi:hypothetical protein
MPPKEKKTKKQKDEEKRIEKERLEAERVEQERIEAERLEKERIENEKAEELRRQEEARLQAILEARLAQEDEENSGAYAERKQALECEFLAAMAKREWSRCAQPSLPPGRERAARRAR